MRKFQAVSGAGPLPRYLLALVSGALLALSFPQPGISPLAWFAFVPLLSAAAGMPGKVAFRLGVTAGCAAYAGIFYWLNIVLTHYGKLPWLLSGALTAVHIVGFQT